MEALSKFDAEEQDEATLQAIRQSWSFGSEEFKIELLQRLEGELGERHSGQLHQQSSSARAERIIAEELTRLGWTESDLSSKRKNDPGKLALAARLRKETTQPSNKLPPALASARPRVRTQTCIKRSATSVTIGI
jgi:hypothetical protein